MTHKQANKGPKFEPKAAMKALPAPADNQPFEIELPRGVQDLIAQERRRANTEIEMYVRQRNEQLEQALSYILRGALGTMGDLPKDVRLVPNETYTKLVQK